MDRFCKRHCVYRGGGGGGEVILCCVRKREIDFGRQEGYQASPGAVLIEPVEGLWSAASGKLMLWMIPFVNQSCFMLFTQAAWIAFCTRVNSASC